MSYERSVSASPHELVSESVWHVQLPELRFGRGSVRELGFQLADLGVPEGAHGLLVTDGTLADLGHAGRVTDHLEDDGFAVDVYDDCPREPAVADVDDCIEFVRDEQGADGYVGHDERQFEVVVERVTALGDGVGVRGRRDGAPDGRLPLLVVHGERVVFLRLRRVCASPTDRERNAGGATVRLGDVRHPATATGRLRGRSQSSELVRSIRLLSVGLGGEHRTLDEVRPVRRLEDLRKVERAGVLAVQAAYCCLCHPWFELLETYRTSGSRRGDSFGRTAGRKRRTRLSGPGSDPFTRAYGPLTSP
mgnify:CR=1 FL=1